MFTVVNEIWCALHYTSLVGVCNSFSMLLENRDKLVWSFPSMLWHWMSHGNHREYSLVPLLCPTPGRSCRPTPREMCSCPVTGTKVILEMLNSLNASTQHMCLQWFEDWSHSQLSEFTLFGVMTTAITTPSSSSVAPGEGTKTGSDGYRPGRSHTLDDYN